MTYPAETRAANGCIIRDILAGKRSPRKDVVLLNAAAALVAAGRVNHLADGLPLASKSIDSGAAAEKLRSAGTVHQCTTVIYVPAACFFSRSI